MIHSETRPLLDPTQRTSDAASLPSYTNARKNGGREDSMDRSGSDHADEALEVNPKVRVLSILFPVSFGVFLAAMDSTIVVSSYASIGSDLKQLQNTSWIATGYMLTLTSFQPLYGKLSDIFGRKACLLFAYIVYGIGCLASGMARNMTELIAARIFTGIGGGGMTTVVSIIFSDVVPLRHRGIWQGILNTMTAMGSASGAPLGGIISDTVGWRWAFILPVPLVVVAFFTVLLALHPPATSLSPLTPTAKLRRIDVLGALTLVIAVFSLLLGLDRGSNSSWSSPFSYVPLLVSLCFAVAFSIVETTPKLAKEPFAPKHIIANASLLGSYFTNFFVYACSMCSMFHLSMYSQVVHGRSAARAGTVLIPSMFSSAIGCLTSGVVMRYTGKYKSLAVGGGVSMVIGSLLIDVVAIKSVDWSLIGAAVGITVVNFGLGVAMTAAIIAFITNVTLEDRAVATAVSYLFRSLGCVLGVAIGSATLQNTLRICLVARLTDGGHDVSEIVLRVRESLSYLDSLDPTTRVIVKGAYEKALLAAFGVSTLLALGAVVSTLYIREKSISGR